MSKKHFIKLADYIREHNRLACNGGPYSAFTKDQLEALVSFCREQNSNFNRERWLDYIAGECGPCGGAVEKSRI